MKRNDYRKALFLGIIGNSVCDISLDPIES